MGWGAPPGRILLATIAVASVGDLLSSSGPGNGLVRLPGPMILVGALGRVVLLVGAVVLVARLGAVGLVGRPESEPRLPPARWWVRLLVGPVVLASVGVLVAADAPLRARWWLSEDRFAALASDLRPAGDDQKRWTEVPAGWSQVDVDGWIGLFPALDAYRRDGGPETFVLTGSFIDGVLSHRFYGFAFLPRGPDGVPWRTGTSYRALGDGWYVWATR